MKLSTVYKLFLPASAPSFDHKGDRGVSLLELIVGVIVGGILIQLAFFAFSVNRELYLKDAAKNDTGQNLKTVFEVVGPTITQVGEGIGTDSNFPVISIQPFPTSSTNSQIIVRQLKMATKLRLCEGLGDPVTPTPTALTEITVLDSVITAFAGCGPVDSNGDGYPDDWASWKSYRENNGGSVRVFIYNGNGVGEWLTYTGEKIYDASGTEITGTPTVGQVAKAEIVVTGTIDNAYAAGEATQLLILEEQGYRLDESTNTLQAIIGGNVINLINNVGQFTVTATVRQDGTSSDCTTLPPTGSTCTPALAGAYNWSQIDGINVTSRPSIDTNTAGLSTTAVNDINSQSQTQTFYPRNLLNF